jgi:hypothetical protein
LQERLAKLAGGVAVLYVGAASRSRNEKKETDDAPRHLLQLKKELLQVVLFFIKS